MNPWTQKGRQAIKFFIKDNGLKGKEKKLSLPQAMSRNEGKRETDAIWVK